jgi:hypothetical protein
MKMEIEDEKIRKSIDQFNITSQKIKSGEQEKHW